MSDRSIESLGELVDQGVVPQTEGVKVLTPNDKFEERLNGIFGEKRPESGTVETEEQPQEEAGESIAARVAAAVVAGTLLGGAGVALSPTGANAETNTPTKIVETGSFASEDALDKMGIKADAGTTDVATPAPNPAPEIPTPAPSVEKSIYPTEHYAERQKKIDEYKEFLRTNGCKEINVEACACWLYSIDNASGIMDEDGLLPDVEKTILKNYFDRDQVIEFGKTGKIGKKWNWNVIYFKDEKGKKTKEPAIAYVYNKDNKYYKIGVVEQCVDWWEKVAPGFLKTLVTNDVRIIYQNQAGLSDKVQVFKYENGMIYYNYSDNNQGGFQSPLIVALGVEQFGVKGEALGDSFDIYTVAVMKARLAVDCCEYITKKTGNKNIADLIQTYQQQVNSYVNKYWFFYGKTLEELESIVFEVKDKNLMVPYGAKSWAEVDGVDVTAKVD